MRWILYPGDPRRDCRNIRMSDPDSVADVLLIEIVQKTMHYKFHINPSERLFFRA